MLERPMYLRDGKNELLENDGMVISRIDGRFSIQFKDNQKGKAFSEIWKKLCEKPKVVKNECK